MSDDPFDDISKLKLPPEMLEIYTRTPAKILKRRENLVIIPITWWERLAGCGSAHAYHVAIFLLHLHWRNRGQPFKLPNGMLKYDGVDRFAKWRVLRLLEQRGFITVEKRPKRSPIIHVQPL
jgi:hypothetical protein